IEIDKYTDFCETYTHKDQYLLKFVINSVLEEIVSQNSMRVWREWVANHQLGVLCLLSENPESHEIELFEYCAKIKDWIEKNLNFTVTMGIGSCVERLS